MNIDAPNNDTHVCRHCVGEITLHVTKHLDGEIAHPRESLCRLRICDYNGRRARLGLGRLAGCGIRELRHRIRRERGRLTGEAPSK